MCGIAGFYSFGEARPEKETITRLFVATESRGTDASGYAWIDGRKLNVFKLPITASKMVERNEWKSFAVPKYAILHTRAATQGDTLDNKNNHPIYSKNGLAIVHNGIIMDDDYLFRKYKLNRDGEVDSEIILALMKEHRSWDAALNAACKVTGSYACAAIWTQHPDELLLWRHTNPLAVAYDDAKDILYFASTEDILKVALTARNNRGFHILPKEVTVWPLPDDSGILVGPGGLKKEYKITPKRSYYTSWWPLRNNGKECSICGSKADSLTYHHLFGDYLCGDCTERYYDD